VPHPEQDATYQHFENASANPFQPSPEDFSLVNVWWLGEAALLTYWNPAFAIPIFETGGFQCEFITADGTDCYVAARLSFVPGSVSAIARSGGPARGAAARRARRGCHTAASRLAKTRQRSVA
jgi:hypothetical protein